MDPAQRKRIMRRSAAQEKGVAASYGGRRTPGSGSHWRNRGDVKTNPFLFECKSTENRTQITIKLADLIQIERRATLAGKVPVLTFDIGTRRYQILTDADFDEITDGGS